MMIYIEKETQHKLWKRKQQTGKGKQEIKENAIERKRMGIKEKATEKGKL